MTSFKLKPASSQSCSQYPAANRKQPVASRQLPYIPKLVLINSTYFRRNSASSQHPIASRQLQVASLQYPAASRQ
jgi:hypothetical protein